MILTVEFPVMPRLLLHSVLILLATGALTGCQLKRPYGFRQFRFDVNTIGRPAFVFDRFQNDNYRSQLPPDVRPTVELTRLPASISVGEPGGPIMPFPDDGVPSPALESGSVLPSRFLQTHSPRPAFHSPSPVITTSCESWPVTSSGPCCWSEDPARDGLVIGACCQAGGLLCPACAAASTHGAARY